jgi:RimJ/RimL family protein N-acetyltransferase
MSNNDPPMVHAFMHDRLGLHWSADFRGVIYVPDEYRNQVASMDHVAVAIGYNAFIGRTCCMHIVIQRPELFSPRMIREAFEFPFVVCNCEAALALVDSTNEASLSFVQKVGFKEVARIPNGGTDGDLMTLQMLRSECRWLNKPH